MGYFDLIERTVNNTPAELRFERARPSRLTTVRAEAHRVAERLGWEDKRIELFGEHCENFAARITLTLSASHITMYAVEATKILLSEFDGAPSMVPAAVALVMPYRVQTYANLTAVACNVESRL